MASIKLADNTCITIDGRQMRLGAIACRLALLLTVWLAPVPSSAQPTAPHLDLKPTSTTDMAMETFLDRLMQSESGGRDTVANPRSTAVGPFQFVVATFLLVAERHFSAETAALTLPQILALRTNRPFARRAAEAFTRDNAAQLAAAGVQPTWPHLRLAFFAGAEGAIRVVKSKPETPVSAVLGPSAVVANPFLARMTAKDLIARSARDILQTPSTSAGLRVEGAAEPKQKLEVPVRCDLRLISCRRWLALAERRQLKQFAAQQKRPRRGSAAKAL